MGTTETADDSAVPASEASLPEGAKRRRGHVTIFDTWCKGCGLCIEFCPRGVFEANGQFKPRVAHPEKCTACHWCDTHCPDLALAVRELTADEAKELEELLELAERGALPAGGDL